MLARHHDPIAAIATAPGRGAVGIVRVSGKGLAPFVRGLLGRELQPRQAHYLPLHHQIRPWAMRKNVETAHRADDRPMPNWTTIK